ncbi:MAG: hypothetical protein QOE89_4077 [Pseudonocardiales bacterium]|jgi:hypothetical protein|nr:hypothetical protein [Pseudonocardiales bacterium]
MWVYLSTWLVQDGEIAELCVGDLLSDCGVRASGYLVDEAVQHGAP